LSTQIGPVAPIAVLPRTMSPSMNSFCGCWACAGPANPSTATDNAMAANVAVLIGSPLRSKDAGRHPLAQDHISNCADVEIKRLRAATLAGRRKSMPETQQQADLWSETAGSQLAALRGFRIVPGY